MNKIIGLAILGLLSTSTTFAASTLSCKDAVEKAVEGSIDGAVVNSLKSRDGSKYIVSYYYDGGDAENQENVTVVVNPSTCEIKSLQ